MTCTWSPDAASAPSTTRLALGHDLARRVEQAPGGGRARSRSSSVASFGRVGQVAELVHEQRSAPAAHRVLGLARELRVLEQHVVDADAGSGAPLIASSAPGVERELGGRVVRLAHRELGAEHAAARVRARSCRPSTRRTAGRPCRPWDARASACRTRRGSCTRYSCPRSITISRMAQLRVPAVLADVA